MDVDMLFQETIIT